MKIKDSLLRDIKKRQGGSKLRKEKLLILAMCEARKILSQNDHGGFAALVAMLY